MQIKFQIIFSFFIFNCVVFQLIAQKPIYFDKLLNHNKIIQTNSVLETKTGYSILSKSIGFDYTDNKIIINSMDINGEIIDQGSCCNFNSDSTVYNLAYENMLSYNDSSFVTFGRYKADFNQKIDDIFLMKLNWKGEKIWERVFGSSKYEYCISAKQTLDKGYILVGQSYSFTDTLYGDYYVVKTDSMGNMQWQKSFGSVKNQIGLLNNVLVMDDGSYVVSGLESNGPDVYVMHLIGLDTIGKVKWDRIIGGTKYYNAAFIRLNKTMDGNILFSSGVARGDGKVWDGNILDAYIAKISKTGFIIWEKKENSPIRNSSVYLTTLEQIDSSILILGYTQSYDTNFALLPGHPFISKLSSKGDVIWRQDHIYSTTSSGYWGNMIQTADGGILAYGYTLGKGWIRKMDSLARFEIDTEIDETSFSPINKDYQIKLFPNPASDQIKIDITLKEYEPTIKTEVIIVDVSGAIIQKHTIPDFDSRTFGIATIDISKLASGVYGVQLRTFGVQPKKFGESVLAVEKLVVIR